VSRIGKKPVIVPDNVKVEFQDNIFKAKGPKGELSLEIPREIEIVQDKQVLTIKRSSDDKRNRSLHGLTRSLVANVVDGVNTGFTKTLQLEGVGYKVELKGTRIMLSLGFSHPIVFIPPVGVEFEVPKTPANSINVKGIDKQIVGEIAAKIRAIRPPEPYKGKGVRYQGEYVRRKAGKTSSK
jgi:large subunit ribosomal protein L6